MDIIRNSLTKAKAASRESSRALKQNGCLPDPSEAPPEPDDPGPLNPNRAEPTKRSQTPAFLYARHRLTDGGIGPRSRGRGQSGLTMPLHPPNYACGRGLRGLESLEATTLGASSIGSELSIGIGRGRGRGFGRGVSVAPNEVAQPPQKSEIDALTLFLFFCFGLGNFRPNFSTLHDSFTGHGEWLIRSKTIPFRGL